MAVPLDYVTVDQARRDLRVDAVQADDATLARYVEDAVSMVEGLTGRSLLGVTAADIVPGLRTCVALALWARFESPAVTPPALRFAVEPFRVIVVSADA